MAEITAKGYVEKTINEYEEMCQETKFWVKALVVVWLAFWLVAFIINWISMYDHKETTTGFAKFFLVLGFIMIGIAIPFAVKLRELSSTKTRLKAIKEMVKNLPSV